MTEKWKPEKPAVEYTDEELKETPVYAMITDADGTSPGKCLPLNLPEKEALRLTRESIAELREIMSHDDPELPPDDIKLANITSM